MRHAKMDMTLYYSHSLKKAKRAAVENYSHRIAPEFSAGIAIASFELTKSGGTSVL